MSHDLRLRNTYYHTYYHALKHPPAELIMDKFSLASAFIYFVCFFTPAFPSILFSEQNLVFTEGGL